MRGLFKPGDDTSRLYSFFIGSFTSKIAETFVDKYIPQEIIDDRFNRLKDLQTSISNRRLSRFVGSYQEVLVEGPTKNNKNKSTGRSDNNNIVIINSLTKPGTIQKVLITKNTPFVLYGDLIS